MSMAGSYPPLATIRSPARRGAARRRGSRLGQVACPRWYFYNFRDGDWLRKGSRRMYAGSGLLAIRPGHGFKVILPAWLGCKLRNDGVRASPPSGCDVALDVTRQCAVLFCAHFLVPGNNIEAPRHIRPEIVGSFSSIDALGLFSGRLASGNREVCPYATNTADSHQVRVEEFSGM